MLFDHPEFDGKVDDVMFVGHSLGGACVIIAAAKVQVGWCQKQKELSLSDCSSVGHQTIFLSSNRVPEPWGPVC